MAASLQASAVFTKTAFNGSVTRTHSFTVPAGSNQILVLKWLTDKFENYSTAAYTYNGTALTIAGTSARATVNLCQIAYLKAPAQGAFDLVMTCADQHNLGSLHLELWQDVDQANTPVWATSEASTATSWTSGAPVSAGYVCTAAITGNFSTTTTNAGTTDVLANQSTYSGKNGSTGYKAAGQPGWTWTGSAQVAGGSLVLKDAAAGTDGTATGVTLTATSSLIAGSASASGNATANGVTFSVTSSLIAGAASGVVNGVLTFQAAGLEFGARTGVGIDTFALDAGVSYRYSVHADGLTLGSAILTSAAITLDGAGKLPNLVSASLTPGVTYRVFAVRQTDGEAATFRMTAS